MNEFPKFPDFFHALWDYDPFPWQSMLAERVAAGAWPGALDLPTASGKTACIEIALHALAAQAERATAERSAPRRIWFVVDRRIVVDEAFARAKKIAQKLGEASDGPLREIADRLREVGGTERPLAVARLRGGVFRDDGWARLPSQPAIITSTVDQLGSRLLFRGYGRSSLTASIFAGLAANDSLVLLDEAHCSVPCFQTLRAVEAFRGQKWSEAAVPTPFAFVVLSATPPQDIPGEAVFPGAERERALDHPVLHRRLQASKQAALVQIKSRRTRSGDPLIEEAAERALTYIGQDKRRVVVMVNRVRTAQEIASTLQERLDEQADVVLLTGRLRPYERDRLVDRWSQFLRAASPLDPPRPIVLVSTQCLEVGADFSFEALVTEVASLDALRQRFGRLDRMGVAGTSPATILVRDRDAKPDKADPDPIYGTALANTWQLLEEQSQDDVIDFGVEQIRSTLEQVDDLSPYLAPAPDAPVLLPAHLDMLCQTSPAPEPEPDVQLFLHGKGRGVPEAQVVWRADLAANDTRAWVETVALCPPVSGEMLSAPLYGLRSFLAGAKPAKDTGDVEGMTEEEGGGATQSKSFLLWRGRDRSTTARDSRRVAPGDVVVLPAAYGIGSLGQRGPVEGMGREGIDLWELVLEPAGRRQAVRLNGAVLAPWMECPPVAALVALLEQPERDRDQIAKALEEVLACEPTEEAAATAPPDWWRNMLREVHFGRMEEHPAGGVILFARASAKTRRRELDLFADDDDLTSAAGVEVSLDDHTDLVERTAAKVARLCLPDEYSPTVQLAAHWHDVGKLDERFQVLLHQGDELAAASASTPLAKSALIPASPARRRLIRETSGLPLDFRHEMLSVQLAELLARPPADNMSIDLFLHLIVSHHGYARPFAPVSFDHDPPPVGGELRGVPITLSAADRADLPPPHRLESGIADRFWRLVRHHGWWGLAYLEGILRLSDWYASESVVNEREQETQEAAA
ncbi:MAG: type I-G CRISPR-associated helicase/endonuclease Cas3g [Acidimicrobiia bacterium]